MVETGTRQRDDAAELDAAAGDDVAAAVRDGAPVVPETGPRQPDRAVPASASPATDAMRLARLYLVLSRVNRAAQAGLADVELLGVACESIVETAGFPMSWAGTVDEASGDVVPVASAGAVGSYLEVVRVRTQGIRSRGPTGEAIRHRRTVVCDDIATDSRMRPWRAHALAHGFRSSVGLPLTRGAHLFGVLTVYGDRAGRFNAGEIELLEELARDVSSALAAREDERERRRAEAALRESDERLRISLDTLLDPVVMLAPVRNRAGRIVDFVYEYANEAACVANAMSRDELLGHRLLEVLPHHRDGLLDAYVRVMETGEPLILDDLEYGDRWGGGWMDRVFDVRASRVAGALVYTWRDVTEHRQAQRRRAEELERRVRERTAELETAQRRAAAVAVLSTAMLEAVDRDAIASALVASALADAGARRAVVGLSDRDGGPLHDVLPRAAESAAPPAAGPGDRDADVLDLLAEAVRAGRPSTAEKPAAARAASPESSAADAVDRHEDETWIALPLPGNVGPVGAVALAFPSPRSFPADELAFLAALAGAAGHALERVRLADAERQARSLVETVVSQMPLGVAIVGPDGREILRNAALEAIVDALGVPGDAGPAIAAVHPDRRPYADADWPVSRSLRTGEVVVEEEIGVLRPDGAPATIVQTSAPVRSPAGGIDAAVVVTVDATRRKEAERLRDAFLDLVSHELRTPITTIYGGAMMLADRWERLAPSARDELIGGVAGEAERLNRMVDDLLVLARAERGVDLDAQGAALVQHRLRAVVHALASRWPDRRFVCEIPDRVPPVVGDEAYLEQVFRNLLGNAAKYGRSEVRAAVTITDDAVEVTVSDDGPGLDPVDLPRVFDLFWRAKRTSAIPGAGIGLFVARRLADAMGARLFADNGPRGAVFTLALRRFDEAGEA